MAKDPFPYSEAVLQRIWLDFRFRRAELFTECGQPVTVLDPGVHNMSDGPDFKQAVIKVGSTEWHGAVELHLKSTDWKLHGHHTNPDYNQVMLHVVVEDNPKSIQLENGASPFTLNLLPHLNGEAGAFLKHLRYSRQLPCAKGLRYISREAFALQIKKAHTEYFDKKADDFLCFYDPNLGPAEAWRKALVLSVFDGLGISKNREPMQFTGRWFLENRNSERAESLIQKALDFAGFGEGCSRLQWNFKGVSPGNRPKKRIAEAVRLGMVLLDEPVEKFLSSHSVEHWEQYLQDAALSNTSRFQILYGTVYLPALYLLGTLFHDSRLSQRALEQWAGLATPVPPSVLKPFTRLEGIPQEFYARKLGAVHQLKSYCRTSRCAECLVLKKAISS